MDSGFAIDMGREALVLCLVLAAPGLITALVVGVLISLFQAVTQIQEQTLSFVPKVVVVCAVLGATMPWGVRLMVDYTVRILENIPALAGIG